MRPQPIDNPVAVLEASELNRAGGFSLAWPEANGRSRIVWAFRTAVLFLCVNYYVIHLAASLYPIDLIPFQESLPGQALRVGLIIVGLAELFLFLIRALAMSAAAISREHLSGRWDLLRLSGMTSQQLLHGKRQALRKHLHPWLLYIIIVRTGMCLSLGYFLSFEFVNLGPGNQLYRPVAIILILLPLMIYLFTYQLTSLVIAVGLLHSAASKTPGHAYIRSISSFLGVWAVLLVSALGIVNQWSVESQSQGVQMDLSRVLGLVLFSALDGGTLLLSQLNYHYTTLTPYSFQYFAAFLATIATLVGLGSLAALAFYTAITTILMRLTEGILEKQGLARPRIGNN